MKHLRGIASSLIVAIAIMMAGSTAISQLNIRVNTEPRPRRVVVHHPREHVRARVYVPQRRHAVVQRNERRDDRRGPERRPENR
jgi:hypothetical protein